MNYYSIGEIKQMARQNLQGKWSKLIPLFLLYILIVGIPNGISNVINQDTGLGSSFSGLSIGISLYTLIVSGPFMVGMAGLCLRVIRNKDFHAGNLFDGFSRFGTSLGSFLLVWLFTTLWSILFIVVPSIFMTFVFYRGLFGGSVFMWIIGLAPFLIMCIFAAFFVMRYQMTYYFVADYHEMGASDCVRHSVHMMQGNIGKLFLLNLSFIGWAIVAVLPLYAGIFLSAFAPFMILVGLLITCFGIAALVVYMNTSQAVFYSVFSGNLIDQRTSRYGMPYDDDEMNRNFNSRGIQGPASGSTEPYTTPVEPVAPAGYGSGLRPFGSAPLEQTPEPEIPSSEPEIPSIDQQSNYETSHNVGHMDSETVGDSDNGVPPQDASKESSFPDPTVAGSSNADDLNKI